MTRDENVQHTGLSSGTVSSILAQFAKEIDHGNFETLTNYSRILRENNMNVTDSIEGFHDRNLMKKIGINPDELKTFLSDVYLPYKDSSLTPSELIENTKRLIEFLKSAKMTPDELAKHNNDLLNERQDLEKQNKTLKENATNAEREINHNQKQNKVTLEIISNFEQTRQGLERNGISVDDVIKLAKMVKSAEKNNWDGSMIIDYLKSSEDYERQIIGNKKELDKTNKENDEKTTQNILLDKKITLKEQHLKKLESEIKTLKNQEVELKASISITTDFSLNQIKTVKEKAIEYISEVQSTYLNSMNNLYKNLSEKSVQVNKKQTDQLEEMMAILDKAVSEIIQLAEKEGNLKTLIPLHKILDSKGEPHEVYPLMITLLERLKIWYQKQNKSTRLISVVDELISIMKNHLNYDGTN